MFDELRDRGFQIEFQSHAKAILGADFPDAVDELQEVLLATSIPMSEIMGSGGGESKGTQRLRRALNAKHWSKTNFVVKRSINGVERESQSHEVDHVREFPDGSRIALEIEWNNKDPFFDRDLENYKRLHSDGAISVGVIVTRGSSLQESLRAFVERYLTSSSIESLEQWTASGHGLTPRQRNAVETRTTRAKNPLQFAEAFADMFVSDKFGEATTHWRKLHDRVRRGVGNPCPLLLIGLPSSIVTFD